MSTVPTSEQAGDVAKPSGRNLSWLWVLALFAIIAVAGIALWFMVSGVDDEPTLTFDGSTLAYTGPEAFDDRLITLNLENTSDRVVTFAWGVISDDTVTEEQHLEWAATHSSEPPWLDMWYRIAAVGPGATKEASIAALPGRIDLAAYGEGTRTYVAGVFEVAEG